MDEGANSGRSTSRALVYSSHLATMGSWARLAVGLAQSLNRLLPTDLATPAPVAPQVQEWAAELSVVAYEREMARQYDLLWNVDVFSYAEPLAKRNLAWVIAPHYNNVPPPDFELLAISDYVQSLVERYWQRICGRLYPWVRAFPAELQKERIILHVGRFLPPGELIDPGHLLAIDQFQALSREIDAPWQLVLVGALVPGCGAHLDQLQHAALGSNVRILGNADQPTLNAYFSMASLVWSTGGFASPEAPLAQGVFPLSVVEGSAAGAVPIAGKGGANAEVVIHGYNGLLVAEPQEFAEVTQALIRAPSAWSLLSQRAQVTSQGWTSEEVFLDRLQAVLQNRPAARPPVPRWLDTAPPQKQVTAVITMHNQAELTAECLKALKTCNPDVQIVLVDNASTDDLSEVRGLIEANGGTYLRRETNDGLGAALAAAKPHCQRPFVLVMHNDVLPIQSGDWLDVLLAEMTDDRVGIVGAKLKYPDGARLQFAGWGFAAEQGGRFFHVGDGEADEPRYNRREEVLGVSSACMVCRLDGFHPDPALQVVYVDLDLCLKVKRQGFRVIYQPAVALLHAEGATRRLRSDITEVVAQDRAHFFATYAEMIERASPEG